MKILISGLCLAVVLGLLAMGSNLFGQGESTTTTVTSGTVSDFSPEAIAVKTDSSTTAVRYSFSQTTTYVDENGNPVSIETVKSGVPVTVYYTQQGGNYVADKVVVRKTTTTTNESTATSPAPAPAPATSTTTVAVAPQQSQVGPPSSDGTVTDADSDAISVRTPASPEPVHYKVHDSTAYVDQSGNPLTRKSLTPGTPVTIFYEQHDDSLYATRVVVKMQP